MDTPTPRVEIRHLDPVRAELVFSFDPEHLVANLEIRGRVIGPRCPGVSTVEVAYPARPADENVGAFHVTVPEPSMWEPECPFLYEAIFEFWRWGSCVGKTAFPIGLRKA
ncbi:MAG: hypothetical protein HY040_17640 [Planctomycetes bacterium]|nr:hypothetical protein [Planctomycetota bacterium]